MEQWAVLLFQFSSGFFFALHYVKVGGSQYLSFLNPIVDEKRLLFEWHSNSL
jgi:hypothetical protein